MKKLFVCSLCMFVLFVHALAQQTIQLSEVQKHIGDSVTVCGKIFGGIYLDKSKNKPTFLNMGAAYPKQLLTVVIWGDKRKLFGYAPEEKLKNKNVCVSGKIAVYNGKAQIVINDISQLKVQ